MSVPFSFAPVPLSSIRTQHLDFADALKGARLAARKHCIVLLVGEGGTGKATIARGIHAASPRAAQPFHHAVVDLQCAKPWFEAQLARAGQGTLYLTDPARMGIDVEWAIQRVLAARTGPAILVGTTRSLEEIDKMEFVYRRDLPADCPEIVIQIPPLRARPQDLPGLFAGFLSEGAAFLDRTPFEPASEEVLRRLLDHAWPGNVLELREVAWRAASCASGNSIAREDLGFDGPPRAGMRRPGEASRESQIIRRNTLSAVSEVQGNMHAAEERLGVPISTLYRRLHEYGVRPADFRARESQRDGPKNGSPESKQDDEHPGQS